MLGELGVGVSGAVAQLAVPPVVLPLQRVAEELRVLIDNDNGGSNLDINMDSSLLAARAARRLGGSGGYHWRGGGTGGALLCSPCFARCGGWAPITQGDCPGQ